ncbi:MAG: hypothetical protein ACQEQ8_01520 [Pseudomonadota bacterium]
MALTTIALLWAADSQFDLVAQLRLLGEQVIQHFIFIFNYVSLVPGSGL